MCAAARWTDAQPPELLGMPFHHNEAFGLRVMHAWVWRSNPAGTSADWNPRVNCDFAL